MERQHNHNFVETYTGPLAQGFDRQIDQDTLMVYLQKFSDDALLETLLPRLEDVELSNLFDIIFRLLRAHLSEEEYHDLFLKKFPEGPRQI